MHDLIKRFLSKEGFHVESAFNGKEGLLLARKLHPEVITLDVIMPGMNGWEVLSSLQSDPELMDIPVVVLSIIDDKNKGFVLGASDYLTKPIERDLLIATLQKYRHPSKSLIQ